jgi:manganese/iron transport system permease protein
MPESHLGWADFVGAWDLFRDAMLCGAIAGTVLGFLGVYVVLRRMVFVSAAVTQSAGLGVALAFYAAIQLDVDIEPIWGAGACALVATLALLGDPERIHLTREAVLGIVFAVTGGAAVLVGSRITQEAHDIQAILFGSAVLVRPFDLTVVAAVGALILLIHVWWFRGLGFASFDPVSARVQRLPVGLLQAVVLVSIGAMVGASARALGAMPVFALSTLPAIAALALGLRLKAAFAVAATIGAVAGFGGYAAAFFLELPVGAAQTTLAAALTALAVLTRVAIGLVRRT